MAMNQKGFFFTVDALLAASVLLGGLLLISSYYVNDQPTIHLNYLAEDILTALDVITVGDFSNSYVQDLIANGTIEDLDTSLLQQAGIFWADSQFGLAQAFIENITSSLLPARYGFGVWIDNDLIYQRNNPPPTSRSSARKLVSGVEKEKPIEGFIAKAKANTYTKVGSTILSFSPEGSGWKGGSSNPGEAIIDKHFTVPSSYTLTNATFYVSIHIQSTGADWEIININNGTCSIWRDNITLIGGEGTFDKKDITGCIVNGDNHIQVTLRNIGYHGHIHPGMLVRLDYTLNGTTSDPFDPIISERIHFDNILSKEGEDSKSGVWQIVPFYVPEGATNVSVKLHIEGRRKDQEQPFMGVDTGCSE